MKDLHRSWGRRLRERRQGMFTQEALADICGISQATLSRIEMGQQPPTDEHKWKLAGALGVTLEELFPYPAIRPPFPQAAA